MLKIFRKLHRWPGIIIAFIAILFATSGIILNHRETFSSIDISRKLLPPGYRYNNWNLSAVRGSYMHSGNFVLVYGRTVIYSQPQKDSSWQMKV
jgi:hypothetical protein